MSLFLELHFVLDCIVSDFMIFGASLILVKMCNVIYANNMGVSYSLYIIEHFKPLSLL